MADFKERDVRQVVLGKDDDDIKEFIAEMPAKFSTYVKELIRRDMNGQDNSDIVEARLNEIITMLKRGAGTPTPTNNNSTNRDSINSKQKNAMNNAMSIFKTK